MMSGNDPGIDNQNTSGSVAPVQDPPGQVSVKFNDSQLQTFPPSASQGKISIGSGPTHDADVMFSKPGSGEQQPPPGWLKAFTVTAYQPYFDVDTSDILDRIKDSLFPLKGTFSEKTASNPDLYGPFWICTTLIFVSASISASVTYLANKLHHKNWDYDIHLLTWSASVLYGYALFVPIILYIVLKYLSAPLGLAQLLCLYGYSLFIFIPAVCLSIIPVEISRWVIAGVAGFMSAMFVASNLQSHIVSAGEKWVWIVAAITMLQLALSIVLKVYLFSAIM
uniref:protein YIPF1 homolog n=1 Tax=Erigeron canadensis TaxID=72917 RepID=UPI001CB981E0|nr:protein YIPF1 homolog [Erigeron canadensis]